MKLVLSNNNYIFGLNNLFSWQLVKAVFKLLIKEIYKNRITKTTLNNKICSILKNNVQKFLSQNSNLS